MSIHTKNDYFPRRLSFERLFNHTTIGRLELFGSLIVPSSNDSFDGDIRSLIVHRHVDVVDANSYPAYSRVLSLTIHSLGAHSMDLTSFLPRHRNLRGLELLEPRFDVSIDQFLPSLDSLTIDVEEFDRRTVLAARHIHHLKFGSRLRRVDGEVFSPTFFRRLHQLDFSLVNLSQLTTDTQCQLSDYLATNLHQRVNFVFPSLNNLTDECLCSQMFLLDVLFQRRDPICAKQCRFNDCPRIRDYFREKYPLVIEPEKNLLPAIEFVADPIDEHLMQFLVNQTTTENNLNGISTLDNLQKYNEILSADPTESIERKETTTTDSTPWLYLCLAFAAFLLVLFLLLLLIFRVRRKYQSKPLPVYL